MAIVNYRAGRTAQAIEFAEQSRDANPDLILPRILLAVHYGSEGRHDEAQTVVREILQVNPELTADQVSNSGASGAFFAAGAEPIGEQLRRAGLP